MAETTHFQGVPDIIYGTAFKFENTASLVEQALNAGFRAIDTAGSKSAYREALVGEAIAAAISRGTCNREELYIQTKFSPYKLNKNPALYPYDITKSIPEQVAESIESSLTNLGVTYIDCLVLHSLYPDMKDNLSAWKAMEALVPSKVLSLSLSNIDLVSLRQIFEAATIKPTAVQNRFSENTVDRPDPTLPADLPYPLVTFDRDVREYCLQHDIAYAPWGLLWGSLDILDGPEKLMEAAGEAVGLDKNIACFACMRSLGGCKISILCGTSQEVRMRDTLAGLDKVEKYLAESEEHRQIWKGYMDRFKTLVDGDGNL